MFFYKDIEDREFQTDRTSMAGRWFGFAHPHLDVTYSISIGSTKGGSDVISMKDVGNNLTHKETGLNLTPYQVYVQSFLLMEVFVVVIVIIW